MSTDDESPWALQVAVRVEKANKPTAAAACRAATVATLALLDDARSQPEGLWHAQVAAWNGARIRKLVRYGRGAAWQRAQEAAGVTVVVDGVEARAFVPSPLDQAPAELRKLQIQSGSLPRDDQRDSAGGASGLIIAVTPEVEMSWGKQAAQCAHAAQRARATAAPETLAAWRAAGMPVTIINPTPDAWPAMVSHATTTIRDGGFTEIPAGTMTTAAWWAEPIAIPPVRLVLLDFDGVIRHFDPELVARLEAEYQLVAGALRHEAFVHPRGLDAITGHLTRAEWIDQIGDAVGSPEAARGWLGMGNQQYSVDPEMLALIDDIHATGTPVALLTNGTDTIGDELAEVEIGERFERVFCSAFMGVAKPSAGIYLQVCAEMGLEPIDVFFTDDSPGNVVGARNAGVRAADFVDAARLRHALTEVGLLEP